MDSGVECWNADYCVLGRGDCQGYRGVWVEEFGWRDSLSGIDVKSFWLDRAELLRFFQDHSLEVETINDEPLSESGPRSYWLIRCPQ